jgi:RIO kinase 1
MCPPLSRNRLRLDEKKLLILEERIDGWRTRVKDDNQAKTYDEVFDQRTLMVIYKLINEGAVSTVDYPVSTGKEGNVFHATANGEPVALKIYRVTNAAFRALSDYILGDPRFKGLKGSKRKIICAWATKEYKNLERMHLSGTRVPRPIAVEENILVMGYLGDETMPAPMLKSVKLDDPESAMDDVIDNMKCIQEAGLVHGDLSEYNILIWGGKTYIIDVGQAVTLDHVNANDWYKRDVENIARYFRHLDCDITPEEINQRVRGV